MAKPKAKAGFAGAQGYAPLVVLPTVTAPETVQDVRSAGYVPILCDEPEKVKLVMGQGEVGGSDLLMSAMYGISGTVSERERSKMVEELYRRMLKREGA